MGCLLEYDNAYIYYAQVFCGSLSFLGSLIVIFTYLFIEKIRIYSFKLVVYLSISELFSSTEYFIPDTILESYPVVCTCEAAMINSVQISSAVWITCIAVTLYQVIVNSSENYKKYECFWGFIAWGLVPLAYSVPIFTKSYGLIGNSCTFTQGFTGTLMRALLYYAPAWIMIISVIFCYIKILIEIKSLQLVEHNKQLMNRLFIYPIVMTAKFTLLSTIRILYFFLGTCNFIWVDFVFHLVVSLTGFCNAVIFICTPMIGKILIDTIRNPQRSMKTEELTDMSSSINLLHVTLGSSNKTNN